MVSEAYAKHITRSLEVAPVAISSGSGSFLTDVNGKSYLDFNAGIAANSLGHCHPEMARVATAQMGKLIHMSRTYHMEEFARWAHYICSLLGFDMAYPMNSGTEANELAIKYARRFGYDIKKIPDGHAKIVIPYGAFLGRSLTATAAVYDPVRAARFGPFAPGFVHVRYSDLEALENLFKEDPNICAYLLEPIQGEEGLIIPHKGYLKGVRELCDKY